MIPLSISQKQVVMNFFADDIKIVKKYFNSIDFDFDEEFRFDVFKEFIYSAAGMFKDLDTTIYNQELVTKFNTIRYLSERYNDFEQRTNFAQRVYTKDFLLAQDGYVAEKHQFELLKAELQMLITKEQSLTARRGVMEHQFIEEANLISDKEAFEHELKKVRREQVDTIHMIGNHKHELDERFITLKTFEDQHREEFLKYFNEIKDKLTYQFTQALNFFGYDFNESLFRNSERSSSIQSFKQEAGIQGDINLCKYLEYYLRNIVPEALSDKEHKERLLIAKNYCDRVGKK
jgi:hypothetical protein